MQNGSRKITINRYNYFYCSNINLHLRKDSNHLSASIRVRSAKGAAKTAVIDAKLGIIEEKSDQTLIDGTPIDKIDMPRVHPLRRYVPILSNSIKNRMKLGPPIHESSFNQEGK